jgi:putative transposase
VADRWFASSQIHHGCHHPDGTPCRLVGKYRLDKQLVCPQTGALVDRDINAARNLRDWPDMPVDAQSVCRPRPSALPAVVPETAAQTIGSTDRLGSSRKTIPYGKAASNEARTGVATATKELRKESA